MKNTFFAEKLDWRASGYHAAPTPASDPERSRDGAGAEWERLEAILEDAKRGEFRRTHELVDLYGSADVLLKFVSCTALGDVGTRPCFEELIADLAQDANPGKSMDFVYTLVEWGNLSVVPVILREYYKFYGFQGSEVTPLFLSDLLEPAWGPISDTPKEDDFDDYEEMVLARARELTDRLGTNDVLVRHGGIFSITSLARLMLKRLDNSPDNFVFQQKSRRLFEANTGIDCSSFYNKGGFQPLQAAVLLERFLKSPDAARFEDGVRYFFGHRIPD